MDRALTNRGFTLIELMVVIGFVTIIAGIAINRFTTISNASSITDDMQQISSLLKSKRLAAFTEKSAFNITINAAGDTLTAIKDPAGIPVVDETLTLQNPVNSTSSTFAINTRGLFDTTGNIRLATMNNAVSFTCIAINNTRIRLGAWDGANCDAK